MALDSAGQQLEATEKPPGAAKPTPGRALAGGGPTWAAPPAGIKFYRKIAGAVPITEFVVTRDDSSDDSSSDVSSGDGSGRHE